MLNVHTFLLKHLIRKLYSYKTSKITFHFNTETNSIDLPMLAYRSPWLVPRMNVLIAFLLFWRSVDLLLEKCRQTLLCETTQTADAVVHEDSFARFDSKKLVVFVQNTLFFYWITAIKSKHFPLHFFCSFPSVLLSAFKKTSIFGISMQQKFQTLFGISTFYSFTIIGDNFVLCVYDCYKQRRFAQFWRKKAYAVLEWKEIENTEDRIHISWTYFTFLEATW